MNHVSMPFQLNTPPKWATAYGQDRYGYFADFKVESADSDVAIEQRMRWIPPGSFQMGSKENEHARKPDETYHKVTLTSGFWLADTACTQELWKAVTGNQPSQFQGPNLPVENISYDDCIAFCQQLRRRIDGLNVTLPTEAQWEYACRANTSTPFSTGKTISTQECNFDGNYPYLPDDRKGDYRKTTVDVKNYKPNAWGLYQMHGNVWEWCLDWYGNISSEHAVDPIGADNGTLRVVRGGSWLYYAQGVRSAFRDWVEPGVRGSYLGFRLLSSVE